MLFLHAKGQKETFDLSRAYGKTFKRNYCTPHASMFRNDFMIWVWMDITTRRLFIKFVVWIVVQQMPPREWKSKKFKWREFAKKGAFECCVELRVLRWEEFMWRWWRTLSWILGVEEIGRNFLSGFFFLRSKKFLVTKSEKKNQILN